MSTQRSTGTAWETRIVRYLHSVGLPHVERRALRGARDCGDIAGLPGVCIEAKNHRRVQLSVWLDEAEKEGRNAGAVVSVVWFHRPGKASAGDGYVLMSGAQFASIVLGADAAALSA